MHQDFEREILLTENGVNLFHIGFRRKQHKCLSVGNTQNLKKSLHALFDECFVFSGWVRQIIAVVNHGVFVVWIWGRLRLGQTAAFINRKAGVADKVGILFFQTAARGIRQRCRGQDCPLVSVKVETAHNLPCILRTVNEFYVVAVLLNPDQHIVYLFKQFCKGIADGIQIIRRKGGTVTSEIHAGINLNACR